MKHWIFVQRRRFGYRRAGKNVNTGDVKVFVLGNQKAGTSVIAALLAERVGLTYSIDLKEEMHKPLIPSVLRKEKPLNSLIRKNALDFSNDLVKEPGLTLLYPELRQAYPEAKFVFVVRDPRDNIRSILNRLNLPGNKEHLSKPERKALSKTWEAIIYNHGLGMHKENYIAHMASRWSLLTFIVRSQQSEVTIVKYEEFKKNKLTTIDSVVKSLGYTPSNVVDHLLNKQFQSKGQPTDDYVKFFGVQNYKKIAKICSKEAELLGYRL